MAKTFPMQKLFIRRLSPSHSVLKSYRGSKLYGRVLHMMSLMTMTSSKHCTKWWFCKYHQHTHWKPRHNVAHLSRMHSLNSCTEFLTVFLRKTFELLSLAPIPVSWFLWSKLVLPILLQCLCWVKILKATSSHKTLTNSVYSWKQGGRETSLSVWEYYWSCKEMYK